MTVGEDYPNQQERCRTILGHAKELPGKSGLFMVAMLEDLLRRADSAAIGGDPIEILRMYKEMKEIKE